MGNAWNFSSGLILGFAFGAVIVFISVFLNGAKLISNKYECTETGFIGKAPHRYEVCITYSMKGAKHD